MGAQDGNPPGFPQVPTRALHNTYIGPSATLRAIFCSFCGAAEVRQRFLACVGFLALASGMPLPTRNAAKPLFTTENNPLLYFLVPFYAPT